MNTNPSSVIVAVDLSKTVFQLAVAEATTGKVVQQHRLSRTQFERWFANRSVELVVMEACGGAHHWARWFDSLGVPVKLLPPAYVRAYVRRNKTDAADACALLQAVRCEDIFPVRPKSVEQQALQGLHRARSQWMGTRVQRINALRGFCREFGLVICEGAKLGLKQIGQALAQADSPIPVLLRSTAQTILQEIDALDKRIAELERTLDKLAKQSQACENLRSIPGIGLLCATAMTATTGGSVSHIRDARRFACGFGITPKEFSTGKQRFLGPITKKGDPYLRTLLIHGARSLLLSARMAQAAGKTLDPLRQWALALAARMHHNKAACAVANKLVRICYAVLRDGTAYGQPRHNTSAPALPA